MLNSPGLISDNPLPCPPQVSHTKWSLTKLRFFSCLLQSLSDTFLNWNTLSFQHPKSPLLHLAQLYSASTYSFLKKVSLLLEAGLRSYAMISSLLQDLTTAIACYLSNLPLDWKLPEGIILFTLLTQHTTNSMSDIQQGLNKHFSNNEWSAPFSTPLGQFPYAGHYFLFEYYNSLLIMNASPNLSSPYFQSTFHDATWINKTKFDSICPLLKWYQKFPHHLWEQIHNSQHKIQSSFSIWSPLTYPFSSPATSSHCHYALTLWNHLQFPELSMLFCKPAFASILNSPPLFVKPTVWTR